MRHQRIRDGIILLPWMFVARCTCMYLRTVQVKWDSFDPSAQGGFLAWLPGFYGTVEGAAESEARWLGPVLPDQAAVLVAALLIAVFTRTDKSFRMRLTNAVSSGGLPNTPSGIAAATLLCASCTCCR